MDKYKEVILKVLQFLFHDIKCYVILYTKTCIFKPGLKAGAKCSDQDS